MSIAERVFHLLEVLDIDQKKFAEEIGVTDKVVSKWKTGTLKSYTKYLRQIVGYFGVSPDYFLEEGVFSNWDMILEYPHAVVCDIRDQIPPDFIDNSVDEDTFLAAWLDKKLCYNPTGKDEVDLIRWFYRNVESVEITNCDELPSYYSKTTANVTLKNPARFNAIKEKAAIPKDDSRSEEFVLLFNALPREQQDIVLAVIKGFQNKN